MNLKGAPIAVVVVLTCALCARLGRRRRQAGVPVSPRETVLILGATWAFAWLALGLPPLLDWSRHVPWSESVRAVLALTALATAPVLFLLAATWLPRLNAGKPDGSRPATDRGRLE